MLPSNGNKGKQITTEKKTETKMYIFVCVNPLLRAGLCTILPYIA